MLKMFQYACVCVCIRSFILILHLQYLSTGVLSRGTTYRVQCQVTAANQSATSAVSFYVRRGVTSCKFSIEGGSYTELGAVRSKCIAVTPLSRVCVMG